MTASSADTSVPGTDPDQPEADPIDPLRIVSRLREIVDARLMPSVEPLLPLLLSLKGKPYSLEEHFPFSPLFRTRRPQDTVWVCGRQIGKSQQMAGDSIVTSAIVPHFTTLYVAPLFEQTRRFSTLVVRPLIHESPVKSLWLGTNVESSVLQRTFKNGSRMMFSFAMTDAGRIRGLSANRILFDESDDIDPSVVPVILDTMSADKEYEMATYSGTPKATDGPLSRKYETSSQAEWWIPCQHCTTGGVRTWNICSSDHHLGKMLGPLRHDISPTNPALICYKCRKPVYSWLGHWRHRFPDRRWRCAGYHIPQAIVPLHYGQINKWATLLGKRENRTPAQFANEVLGEPLDSGQKLLSGIDLRRACSLPWKNNPDNPDPQVLAKLASYRSRVLAIDWGGGGASGVSFTVFALLGFCADGTIEVAWAKRYLGTDHIDEAREAVRWYTKFQCDMLVHDYTGAGVLRDTMMVQAGLPLSRNMPIQYVASSQQDLLIAIQPTEFHRRLHWRLDKTRSLHYTIAAIRLGKIKFFQFDYTDVDNPGLIEDFTRLIEHRTALEVAGGNVYRIQSNGRGPDDFAQAINIGAACTWQHNDAWPNFAAAASLELNEKQRQEIGGYDYDWNNVDFDQRLDYYG